MSGSDKDVKEVPVVGGEAHYDDKEIENDYFFQKGALDCWPKILEFLTQPTHIYDAMCASPLLYDSLRWEAKDGAVFALGAAFLIKKNYLKDQQSILSSCLVSRKACNLVNQAISKVNPSWAETSNRFEDGASIRLFLDHFEERPHTSPFVGDLCTLLARDQETFDASLELLRRYGQSLKRCTLGIGFDDQSATVFHHDLVQALALVPSVRWLALKLGGECEEEEEDPEEINMESYPPLVFLKELELSWSENGGMPSPSKSSIKPTLQAYGKQLTKFKCGPLLFRIITPDLLPNLRHLELSSVGWNTGVSWDIFRHPKTEWPLLESLTLNGSVKITEPKFLSILNGFENNLKKLQLWRVAEPEKQEVSRRELKKLVEFGFRNYPNVKNLSVGVSVVWSRLWDILPELFGSLEFLTIRVENGLGIPIVLPHPYQVDSVDIRMKIFRLFPKLQEILWIQIGIGMHGDKKILFQRPGVIRFVDV